MTPKEARSFCIEFAKEIGPKGQVMMSLDVYSVPSKGVLRASAYINWTASSGPAFTVYADTFQELCDLVEKTWAELHTAIIAARVEKMALEIIRITNARGQCTDADLRALYEFSDADVKTLGARACEVADTMAGRGPFSIIVTNGSNGAPRRDDATASPAPAVAAKAQP